MVGCGSALELPKPVEVCLEGLIKGCRNSFMRLLQVELTMVLAGDQKPNIQPGVLERPLLDSDGIEATLKLH